MSKVDDLLNNNWGFFLQQFLSGDSAVRSNYFNTVGSNRGLRIWGVQSHLFNQVDGGAEGSRIATGSGVTPATRSDFNIETQENKASTGDGGWNSGLGKIDIPMVTTAVSNYSLTETALIGAWYSFTQLGIAELLLSRDNISPVSVLIGQTINVDYNLLLS